MKEAGSSRREVEQMAQNRERWKASLLRCPTSPEVVKELSQVYGRKQKRASHNELHIVKSTHYVCNHFHSFLYYSIFRLYYLPTLGGWTKFRNRSGEIINIIYYCKGTLGFNLQ